METTSARRVGRNHRNRKEDVKLKTEIDCQFFFVLIFLIHFLDYSYSLISNPIEFFEFVKTNLQHRKNEFIL